MARCRLRLSLFIFIFTVIGCGTPPLLKYSGRQPPGVYSPVSMTGVQDDRAGFRALFCAVTGARKGTYADERPCGEALHRTEDEGTTQPGLPVALLPPKPLSVVIITGIFGECIGDYLLPFSDGRYFDGYSPLNDGYAYLRALGYEDIQVIVTPGRSSAAANGRMVHEQWQRSA